MSVLETVNELMEGMWGLTEIPGDLQDLMRNGIPRQQAPQAPRTGAIGTAQNISERMLSVTSGLLGNQGSGPPPDMSQATEALRQLRAAGPPATSPQAAQRELLSHIGEMF